MSHKRAKSELSNMVAELSVEESGPASTYESVRRSLKPLKESPNVTPSPKRSSMRHARSRTVDEAIPWEKNHSELSARRSVHFQENEPPDPGPQNTPDPISSYPNTLRYHESDAPSPDPHSPQVTLFHSSPSHTPSRSPRSPIATFSTPELETLKRSSTRHFRTLSKFAQSGEGEELAMSNAVSPVDMQGRRNLKRSDSLAGSSPKGPSQRQNGSAWAAGSWMDKKRLFLQAYQYLCHIGEAKEWIEAVIQKPIPPVLELEEALRDGVILAEIVQAICPNRIVRIFRHRKLQYRHSDNIAVFFRFLDVVGMDEAFRFELVDLYEKKNIPKVIHCIHVLSYELNKKHLVNIRMGNLVGQLQFERHELEETQKGLDKSGVSMPSFDNMAAKFGAEPEPESAETEEERMQREWDENEATFVDLQAQIRGSMMRLKLGVMISMLQDAEPRLLDLQSTVRGRYTRQRFNYRLSWLRSAVSVQALSRGFLVRSRHQKVRAVLEYDGILALQSLIRGANSRADMKRLQRQAAKAGYGVKLVQTAMRGMLARRSILEGQRLLDKQIPAIVSIQACGRATIRRTLQARLVRRLEASANDFALFQAVGRASTVRNSLLSLREEAANYVPEFVDLQSILRAISQRQFLDSQLRSLVELDPSVVDLQSMMRGAILRRGVEADVNDLRGKESLIIELQSLVRAASLRIEVGGILTRLESCEVEIAQLQSLARAMIVRTDVEQTLSGLEATEDGIVDFQAQIRGSIIRSRFEEKRRYFQANMEKVVKAQSFVRGHIQGQAYKSLTSGKNPPVATVKGFVHLLNDSDFDFDEEIEFERLRKVVVQQVRQNEMAEQYIGQLDIKIALLVKNKITLDEVIKHQKHYGGHIGSLSINRDITSKDPFDLKALNKASRRKLEQYQVLFFLLQTHSQYLSRLFRRLRESNTPEKEFERIRHLMMGLFGYSQKRREEYYLIKLLARSAKEEIESFDNLSDYLRCKPVWHKVFASYAKSPRDRRYMRGALGPLVRECVMDNPDLDLESDPIHIYRTSINDEELRTGRQSRRAPNAPREEAIRDPETRAIFIQHLQDLRDITDHFLTNLEETLPRIPYGVRYISQQLYECLLARFSDQEHGLLLQIVGFWLWKSYFQPAILEPEKHGAIDRGFTQEQKKNLGAVGKVIAQIASGRLFGMDNVYLQPLNSFIGESIQRLGQIWGNSEL